MSKKIYIGDVVTFNTDNTLGVILDVSDQDTYYVYTENGCVEEWSGFRIKKTGKDINPQKLLFEKLI